MTNTPTQEITPNVPDADTPLEESKFKELVDKDTKVLDNIEEKARQIDELNSQIDKATYSLQSVETKIQEKKQEFKDIDTDDFGDDDMTNISEIIDRKFKSLLKTQEDEASQNLLTGIEDKYERQAIETEMNNLSPSLTKQAQFDIARRNVDLIIKAKSYPKVDGPVNGSAPSNSFNDKAEVDIKKAAADLARRKKYGLI